MKLTHELLQDALWKLRDVQEAIVDGSFDCPDTDWKRDLETLVTTISEKLYWWQQREVKDEE